MQTGGLGSVIGGAGVDPKHAFPIGPGYERNASRKRAFLDLCDPNLSSRSAEYQVDVDLREDLQGSGRDQGLSIQHPALLMFLEGLGKPEEDHPRGPLTPIFEGTATVRNSCPTPAAASPAHAQPMRPAPINLEPACRHRPRR
jgi:hypothetical protein